MYLRWVQEAALAHSTAVGLDQAAYLARGEVWVVRSHQIEYLRPALEGEQLHVETRVVSMAAANSVRRTRIVRARDGTELCRASTDWVFIDLRRGRPIRITRRGKPAAVLVSEAQFQRVQGAAGRLLGDAILAWRRKYGGVGLTDEEIGGWRDRSVGSVPNLRGEE